MASDPITAAVKAAGHAVWERTGGYPSTAQTDNARIALLAAMDEALGADRLIVAREVEALRAERDRYRFALIDAANDIEALHAAGFDSSRREAAEAGLERIRQALQGADL